MVGNQDGGLHCEMGDGREDETQHELHLDQALITSNNQGLELFGLVKCCRGRGYTLCG